MGGAGGGVICEPSPEICDGVDNDCDGVIDNIMGEPTVCTAGEGACAVEGIERCEMGEWVCDAVAGEGSEEICNELDDDCDGEIDEEDVCAPVAPARTQILLCGTHDRDLAVLFQPEDGVSFVEGCAPDANTRSMAVTRGGVASLDQATLQAWVAGGGVLMTEFNVSDEVFNLVFPDANVVQGARQGSCRDNINPVVRFNEGDAFWVANGELPLEAAGASGCGYDLSAYPGITALGGWSAETVSLAYRDHGAGRLWLVEGDWQDNQADADAFNASTQQIMRSILLSNGGVPIVEPGCAEDAECGEGEICIDGGCEVAAQRPILMRCGASDRDVTAFIDPARPLQLEEGCVPRDDVQALLVTRRGPGSLNADALQAYLQGGGNVITEFSASDEVFNLAFGANVAQGNFTGSCIDGLNPVVRFNEDGAFWQANGALPLEAANNSSCGHDLSAYPEITALGGWSAETVSLAYRDLGAGRLWLVEGDWQDLQNVEVPLSDASLALMRAMIYPPARAVEGPVELGAGVLRDVPVDDVLSAGFQVCYEDLYGDVLDDAAMMANCTGEVIVGCMQAGADTLQVASKAPAGEAFMQVDGISDVAHLYNGVWWYYTPNFSFGFAPEGVGVQRSQCDISAEQGEDRLCWHTMENVGGYRCGAETGLNQSMDWARVVYARAAEVVEEGRVEERPREREAP